MAQVSPSAKTPMGRATKIVLIVILLIPAVLGVVFSNGMVEANKAGCAVIQSFGSQLGGGRVDQVVPPTTAAECRNAVEAQRFFFNFVGVIGAYILSAGAVLTVIAGSVIFRKKPATPAA